MNREVENEDRMTPPKTWSETRLNQSRLANLAKAREAKARINNNSKTQSASFTLLPVARAQAEPETVEEQAQNAPPRADTQTLDTDSSTSTAYRLLGGLLAMLVPVLVNMAVDYAGPRLCELLIPNRQPVCQTSDTVPPSKRPDLWHGQSIFK